MLEPKEQARALYGQDVDITVGLKVNKDGYIDLYWSNNGAVGRWDYVALYIKDPDEPYGYLTGEWHYTSNQSSPYESTQEADGRAYFIGYGAWDYSTSEYKIVVSEGPTVCSPPTKPS